MNLRFSCLCVPYVSALNALAPDARNALVKVTAAEAEDRLDALLDHRHIKYGPVSPDELEHNGLFDPLEDQVEIAILHR